MSSSQDTGVQIMVSVPLSYFSKADADGHAASVEQRIKELVKSLNPGENVTLVDDDGIAIATCSNEEELRNVLHERGIL